MTVKLPDGMPVSISRLPVDKHGYPIPWFVAEIDGQPDFRVIRTQGIELAVGRRRCWICGESLVGLEAFVVGPMCAVNRTSAEPPSHATCAEWSARACPFLSTPKMIRRESGLPDNLRDVPGVMLTRNPGVTLVWKVRPGAWSLFSDGRGGRLFYIGEPRSVSWLAEGRDATRLEVVSSIESGLPLLQAEAEKEPGGLADLDELVEEAMKLVPA